MVDDNFHYMDESHRYELGKYDSLNEARNAAMKIVDEFLIENKETVADEGELIAMYCLYGEDPFILNDDLENHFPLDHTLVKNVKNYLENEHYRKIFSDSLGSSHRSSR